MTDREFESRIERFEQDWRQGGPRPIADYLEGPFETDASRRGCLLVELICIDLEYRWRNAALVEPPSLADYAEQLPELGSIDQLPIDLISEAYRVRRRWGDRPSHTEFLTLFGRRREEIQRELIRVDAEIAEESEPAGGGRAPNSAPTEPEPTGAGPEVLTVSHRDFLLLRLIGVGRTGKVYAARLADGGGGVAVKFLRKPLLKHPEVVERFIGEARIVTRLRHSNIVEMRGLGRTGGGSYFIAMELVDGHDLAARTDGRPVPEQDAIGWAIQLCDAVSHAHERAIVHCDLKPSNVLVDRRGAIKVTDFGLARWLAGDAVPRATVEGTAPFMAPEQVSRRWGPIDHRTDIYGIGAVLFALLTGRAPVVGPTLVEILAEVVSSTPVISPARLRPELSQALSDVCRRCLDKEPAARYPTAIAVRSALAALRIGAGSDASGQDR